MTGKIIKGIAGFYYISSENGELYEAHGRGLLRKENKKPLPGDNVSFEVISAEDRTAVLNDVLPRKNELIRPAVANVDQVLLVLAAAKPEPNLLTLDRMLLYLEHYGIPILIYFNKQDLEPERAEHYRQAYLDAGYSVICGSVGEAETKEKLRALLSGKTTVFSGPSGVGKSSLINLLCPEARMTEGELSRKIDRGKQTTRHTELFKIDPETFIIDTPGFTSFDRMSVASRELRDHYPEFVPYSQECRYAVCKHYKEKAEICAVKRAVKAGMINRDRYLNYRALYEEIKRTEETY